MEETKIKDLEMTKEELSNLLQKRDEELEEIQSELQILKSNEVVLKDTIIRLAMKMVGIIQ